MEPRRTWDRASTRSLIQHVTNDWTRENAALPVSVRWQAIAENDGHACTWMQAKAKSDWIFRCYKRIVDYETAVYHSKYRSLTPAERKRLGLPPYFPPEWFEHIANIMWHISSGNPSEQREKLKSVHNRVNEIRSCAFRTIEGMSMKEEKRFGKTEHKTEPVDLEGRETASEYGTSDVPSPECEWPEDSYPSSDGTGYFHNGDESDAEDCPCHVHRDLRSED
ncbi:hypothetical protein R1sor_003786 [Riccia sorocarpa]|uniref:Uncharacterized protein n=1 Tax=Riccia sorocarpa TaxID=122646 RepID=A0ABD3H6J6_9MARC